MVHSMSFLQYYLGLGVLSPLIYLSCYVHMSVAIRESSSSSDSPASRAPLRGSASFATAAAASSAASGVSMPSLLHARKAGVSTCSAALAGSQPQLRQTGLCAVHNGDLTELPLLQPLRVLPLAHPCPDCGRPVITLH